ncbi:DUF2779 domain-containing protein [candidate division KSB1 bacterium]|nr:DUF2779 domain-containing protein [candidate division KSB1 bacterium]
MGRVTKEVFLNAVVCPALGWMLRNPQPGEEPVIDMGARFRMEEGAEVGRRARNALAGGELVAERDSDRAVVRMRELLADKNVGVIFEGAFNYGNYVARADVLQRLGNGWHLIEVKSSVNDDDELVDDLSYTAMVCQKARLEIKKASLLLISKDYRLGMDDAELFTEIEHTDDAFSKAMEFSALIDQIDRLTGGAVKPEAEIIKDCKGCEYFPDCTGKGIKNHIFELPRLSAKKFELLKEMGVFSIGDIPADFDFTANQRKVHSSVKTNAPMIADNFGDLVNSVEWPAFYLDFETMMTAIPIYPDTAPYTQIPTQYSIHKCSDFGKVEKHFQYLADPSMDCRHELAGKLIEDLEGEGSIVTYSSFEKTTISGLAKLFPDLAGELEALIERIVDLEKIIKDGFYHPAFHGKTSIKTTLPALVPDMSYEGLEIGDGSCAMAAFAYMAMGRYSAEEMEKVKADLLEYCGQDTMAMVRLHEKLGEYV